ncbi:hypothetical protein [Mesorhizobium sp. B2-1-2]|uniref:hypothetical protein n=1 Tax=Mesorhizobium sp. B2-1-2 TaxID=2589973 RepID=UPI00112A822C|nr:hypothetical protein [Mesorhizobium sp. B2-1-2]TPN04500.1 hypothetical protein FJ971_29585 [Mesorhizobium sp. B2-1-2]
MKRAALGGIVALAIASQAYASDARPVTGARLDAVQNSVKAMLKDPGSANFEFVLSVQKGAGEFVCGKVNARNGFGGYAGFAPFSGLLVKRGDAFVFQWVKLAEPAAIRTACSANGIHF